MMRPRPAPAARVQPLRLPRPFRGMHYSSQPAAGIAARAATSDAGEPAPDDTSGAAGGEEGEPKKKGRRSAAATAPKPKKAPLTEEEKAAKEAEKAAKAAAKREEKAAAKKAAEEEARLRAEAAASRRAQRNTAKGVVPELDVVTTPGGAAVPRGMQWFGLQARRPLHTASAGRLPSSCAQQRTSSALTDAAPVRPSRAVHRRQGALLRRAPHVPLRALLQARAGPGLPGKWPIGGNLGPERCVADSLSAEGDRRRSLRLAVVHFLRAPPPCRAAAQLLVARYPTEEEWTSRKKAAAKRRAAGQPEEEEDAGQALVNSGPPVVEGLVLVRALSSAASCGDKLRGAPCAPRFLAAHACFRRTSIHPAVAAARSCASRWTSSGRRRSRPSPR